MRSARIAVGVILVAGALLAHVLSAQAIGGSQLAYRDHILGFFIILLVTGLIIAGLGWRFWKGRHDITLLIVGVVQAVFGVIVWINRYSVHG